jgi:hypothetical protein
MTGSKHGDMAHGVLGTPVSAIQQHSPQSRYACKTDNMHAAMVTAQERHCHVSTEEAERCASPINCWLLTSSPQEGMMAMGNLHHVPLLVMLLLLVLLLLLSR